MVNQSQGSTRCVFNYSSIYIAEPVYTPGSKPSTKLKINSDFNKNALHVIIQQMHRKLILACRQLKKTLLFRVTTVIEYSFQPPPTNYIVHNCHSILPAFVRFSSTFHKILVSTWKFSEWKWERRQIQHANIPLLHLIVEEKSTISKLIRFLHSKNGTSLELGCIVVFYIKRLKLSHFRKCRARKQYNKCVWIKFKWFFIDKKHNLSLQQNEKRENQINTAQWNNNHVKYRTLKSTHLRAHFQQLTELINRTQCHSNSTCTNTQKTRTKQSKNGDNATGARAQTEAKVFASK